MFSLHTSYSTLCILAVGMSGAPPDTLLGQVLIGPNPNGIGGGGGGGGICLPPTTIFARWSTDTIISTIPAFGPVLSNCLDNMVTPAVLHPAPFCRYTERPLVLFVSGNGDIKVNLNESMFVPSLKSTP